MKYHGSYISLLLLLLMLFPELSSPLSAQQFQWRAPVKPVYANGFYKIFLPPGVTGKMQPDFADIRIYSKDNDEVPYVFINDRKVVHSEKRNPLKIIEKSHILRKGYTRLVVKNDKRKIINNLCFTIEQDIDEAWVKVSGSNDQKKWVIIKDNSPYLVQPTDKPDEYEVKIMDVAASEYKYYELRLFDADNNAITPMKAYYYNMQIHNINYTRIPEPVIDQYSTQSGKLSVVEISFQQSHYIDKLEFSIEGPEYYLRKAALNNSIPIAEKKFNLKYYEQINEKFELRSEKDNVLNLTNYKAKDLELIIENKDNKPITIEGVKAYQVKKYLVARLKQDKRYTLYFGNKQIQDPIYDLKYFKDSITGDLPSAEIKHIMSVKTEDNEEKPLFNISPFYLWLGIGLVLLFMIYMSVRILEDLNTERENENTPSSQ